MDFNYLPSNHLIHHQIFRDHNIIPSHTNAHKYIKNIKLTQKQLDFYNINGYIVIEDALNNIDEWIRHFDRAVGNRSSKQIFPDNDSPWAQNSIKKDDNDYRKQIFTHRIYLSMLDSQIKPLVKSAGKILGKMASELANIDTVRLWHEEALIKPPMSNQLRFHYDGPSWSFNNDKTLTAWIALDNISYDNGCMWMLPGSHKIVQSKSKDIKYKSVDFTQMNMSSIINSIPELKRIKPIPIPVKKGSIEFHSAYVVHGSGPNFTNKPRKAFTFAMFPDGARFNGNPNILTNTQLAKLKIGDLLNDNKQNPILYSKL
eukprot:102114_1